MTTLEKIDENLAHFESCYGYQHSTGYQALRALRESYVAIDDLKFRISHAQAHSNEAYVVTTLSSAGVAIDEALTSIDKIMLEGT